MLTVKRLNNLYMYFLLFRTIEDRVDNTHIYDSTISPHISYIEEKYDIFFKNIPNKDNIFINLHFKNKDIWDRCDEYTNKWRINTSEFFNTDVYSKWLFTIYLVHSKKETEELRKKYDNITKDELIIRRMLLIYNKFFNSYDDISEENLEYTIHAKLKEYYQELLKNNRYYFRNVYINQLKNQNI